MGIYVLNMFDSGCSSVVMAECCNLSMAEAILARSLVDASTWRLPMKTLVGRVMRPFQAAGYCCRERNQGCPRCTTRERDDTRNTYQPSIYLIVFIY